ncbi:hypothetical protein, partial [Rhizobium johnstonii]|uniref:hypothetical protein n=1 Tax=Rhizobium johnstonii TaxID=3019933 RepID=UPI003F9C8E63
MITASIPSQIPVWLDTPIHSLIDNGRRLKIETSRGSISARAAIIGISDQMRFRRERIGIMDIEEQL